MKKTNYRQNKVGEGRKKSIFKFRDTDKLHDESDSGIKRRKDEGKRMHREKTIKDIFLAEDH